MEPQENTASDNIPRDSNPPRNFVPKYAQYMKKPYLHHDVIPRYELNEVNCYRRIEASISNTARPSTDHEYIQRNVHSSEDLPVMKLTAIDEKRKQQFSADIEKLCKLMPLSTPPSSPSVEETSFTLADEPREEDAGTIGTRSYWSTVL